jgi:uncharacterized membrane protein YhaH (DUF805 family)
MNWYIEVLKKYAVFKGRARRKEYWYFTLVHLIITFLLTMLDGHLSGEQKIGWFSIIYAFAIILPCFAVTARRLHDTGRNGWWILLSFLGVLEVISPLLGNILGTVGIIVLFILLLQPSEPGTNRFGPNPIEDAENSNQQEALET